MAKVNQNISYRSLTGRYPNPLANFVGKRPEVNGWVISEFVLRKIVPVVGFHPYPLTEEFLLAAVTCWYHPEYIFEWGTNIGKSARIFYEVVTQFDLKSNIYIIDLPEGEVHIELPQKGEAGFFIKDIPKVNFLRGEGLTTSLGIVNDKSIYNKKILFFLDGDHSYETIKNEIEEIYKVCQHACIVVHDTFFQTEESNYNIGPYKAIHEFLETHSNRKIIFSADMSLPGMTAII